MKPNKIFIVRHGESQGNVNRKIYETVPDYAIQLTDVGKAQAARCGETITNYLGINPSIQFYVSPFWRTRQTYLGITKAIQGRVANKTPLIKYYEDPRLREQEWTRNAARDSDEAERDNYGHFYYRFNGGESCADVYDRVSDFMGTMHRDFKKTGFPRNAIIVTHGMTMRLFLMRWFHASVEEFESWGNPKNCNFFLLELRDNEKYELVTPLRTHIVRHSFQFPWGEDKDYFPYPHVLPYESESGQSSH
jgi:broad specificity phosphatase PhoE